MRAHCVHGFSWYRCQACWPAAPNPEPSLVELLRVDAPKPLPGHLAPLDRRHRWLYMKTNAHGDFRYRCSVCRRWKTVAPIQNLIARKVREAEFHVDEYLSETLFR